MPRSRYQDAGVVTSPGARVTEVIHGNIRASGWPITNLPAEEADEEKPGAFDSQSLVHALKPTKKRRKTA